MWSAISRYLTYCLERDTLVRSTRTALVVGSILAVINHGQEMLSGQLSPRWIVPMLVTYLVPFSVATFGQVQGKRQRDRAYVGTREGMTKGTTADMHQ